MRRRRRRSLPLPLPLLPLLRPCLPRRRLRPRPAPWPGADARVGTATARSWRPPTSRRSQGDPRQPAGRRAAAQVKLANADEPVNTFRARPPAPRPPRPGAARERSPTTSSSPPCASWARCCARARSRSVELTEAYLQRLETIGPTAGRAWSRSRASWRSRRRRRRTRSGAAARPRPAARHPVRRQGPAGHQGHPDHLGRRAVPRAGLRLRRHRGRAAARRRARCWWPSWRWSSWRAAWATTTPTPASPGPGRTPWNPRLLERRLVQRLGRGDRGRPGRLRHRLGDLGLDPDAGRVLRRLRPAAHLRPGLAPRRDGAVLDARQARARCAAPRTTAAWCWRPWPAPTRGTPPPCRRLRLYAGPPRRRRPFRIGVLQERDRARAAGGGGNFEKSLEVLRTFADARARTSRSPTSRGGPRSA